MNSRSYFDLKLLVLTAILFFSSHTMAQVKWVNTNEAYAPIPVGFDVFKTTDSLNGRPFIAYYIIADLKNKALHFTTDTSYKRRLTPAQFYVKNNQPLLVVNATFFSFATNQNLNIVIKNSKLVSYNVHTIPGRGKDTFTFRHPFNGALGISKKREADVAWVLSDSSKKTAFASQTVIPAALDSVSNKSIRAMLSGASGVNDLSRLQNFKKWKMQTAIGGGPVLVQNAQVKISNNEELKFVGKAIDDLHPRTLMGYTTGNKLIIMVIEGATPE
ncbi:MAG: phosphodiester glycosidase family protein [Ferruginibacter sp.]